MFWVILGREPRFFASATDAVFSHAVWSVHCLQSAKAQAANVVNDRLAAPGQLHASSSDASPDKDGL